VAYLAGALKAAGYTDLRFIDAMTHHLSEDEVRRLLQEEKPDLIGCTAITPAIYKAERLLQIAKEVHPQAVTVLAAYTHLHVPPGADRGDVDRHRGARRGRGDPRQSGARDRPRPLAG